MEQREYISHNVLINGLEVNAVYSRDSKPLHMAFGEKGGRCYYLGEEADWK